MFRVSNITDTKDNKTTKFYCTLLYETKVTD